MNIDMQINSWENFVKLVIKKFNGGSSNQEISESLQGKQVKWKGKITDIETRDEVLPRVVLEVSPKKYPLDNSTTLLTDHLSIIIEASNAATWDSCHLGDIVSFSSVIGGANELFPAIQVVTYEGEAEGLLKVKLKDGVFLGKE